MYYLNCFSLIINRWLSKSVQCFFLWKRKCMLKWFLDIIFQFWLKRNEHVSKEHLIFFHETQKLCPAKNHTFLHLIIKDCPLSKQVVHFFDNFKFLPYVVYYISFYNTIKCWLSGSTGAKFNLINGKSGQLYNLQKIDMGSVFHFFFTNFPLHFF